MGAINSIANVGDGDDGPQADGNGMKMMDRCRPTENQNILVNLFSSDPCTPRHYKLFGKRIMKNVRYAQTVLKHNSVLKYSLCAVGRLLVGTRYELVEIDVKDVLYLFV